MVLVGYLVFICQISLIYFLFKSYYLITMNDWFFTFVFAIFVYIWKWIFFPFMEIRFHDSKINWWLVNLMEIIWSYKDIGAGAAHGFSPTGTGDGIRSNVTHLSASPGVTCGCLVRLHFSNPSSGYTCC